MNNKRITILMSNQGEVWGIIIYRGSTAGIVPVSPIKEPIRLYRKDWHPDKFPRILVALPYKGATVEVLPVPYRSAANTVDMVAAVMYETLRMWCNYWETVDEFIPHGMWKQGEKYFKIALHDRREYMRLQWGDRVDDDPAFKEIKGLTDKDILGG